MTCDALGLPIKFITTGGNVHDVTQAEFLLKDEIFTYVLGDKGYDCNALIEQIKTQGGIAVIPPKSNRKTPREYDKDIYKERNAIERLFGRLKENRRITTRYEKSKINFDAFIDLACAILWLK